jgi:hypothetical protein
VRDEQLASGIQVLLGGVKIAMIASFVGLFFTIVNSGWFFRRTKSRVEYQKNVFYLYLQSELLPVSGDAVASTFQLLQNNLTRFNDSFTNNVDRLSGVFSTNVEALKLQEKIMSSIERIDLGEIAHYNIKVLKEIRTSTKEFERFNGHFENVNSFVENSRVLSERMTDILNRTDDLQSLADAYVKNMEKSETLLSFVAQHLLDLENLRRETSESVAEVGIRIKDAFGGLETHMHQSTKSLEEFTVHELDLLKTALADSRTNLSNLQFLADLKDDVSSFKDSSASQGERIRTSVVALNTATAETNHTLRALLDQSTNSGFNRVTSSIRRLLRQERTDEGS